MRWLAVIALTTGLTVGLAVGSAWAGDVVATASATDAHPPGAQAAPPGPLSDAANADRSDDVVVRDGPCGPTVSSSNDSSGAPDTHPHGEVGVSVGSSGYREVEGYVCKPLANGGAIAIGAATQQGGPTVRWGR